MSSREAIVGAVRANKPLSVTLPEIQAFVAPEGNLIALFTEAIQAVGGQVERGDVKTVLDKTYPDASVIGSRVEGIAGTVDWASVADPHDLADMEVLMCQGRLGVAENGAIWLPESAMGHRTAPFITQHLVVVLDAKHIVWNMHEAYAHVQVDAEGFGTFIAGPSKTADIEQSLVIGAHGPRSLTVVLLHGVADS